MDAGTASMALRTEASRHRLGPIDAHGFRLGDSCERDSHPALRDRSAPKRTRPGATQSIPSTARGALLKTTALIKTTALTMALCIALPGCSMLFGPTADRSESVRVTSGRTAAAAAEDGVLDTGGLSVYLETMRTLIEADSLTQADTFRAAAEAADVAPTTTNRLNYALALAVPGHLGSNDALAQQRLSALLASAGALQPAEGMLATIQLHEVEQRLVLELQATELRTELGETIETQDAESTRRIQTLIDENRRLQAELDDATSRLEAIARIEQTIRELEDDSN